MQKGFGTTAKIIALVLIVRRVFYSRGNQLSRSSASVSQTVIGANTDKVMTHYILVQLILLLASIFSIKIDLKNILSLYKIGFKGQ